MSLSISQKLVAAFVGLTLLLLTATLGLARWSFEQGFLDYVNALEQSRLEQVRLELADEFLSEDRSWSGVSEERFATLMRRSGPHDSFGPPPDGKAHPPPGRRPPPPRAGTQGSPPTALYDVENNLVAGTGIDMDTARAIRVPIVLDGDTIGELRSEPRRRIASPLETEFSRQQLRTSWMLGISSLILAFAVSLILARGLLAPVRRMMNGVARLSSGDYSHRLNEQRSDELGKLTRDLDRLGSTLDANQSSRRRLLADISHELRTPLAVLSGEIEALQDGLRPFDQAQLESLDQEVQRLRYLVDDLYELSIADVGGLRYQFTTVDLVQSVGAVIDGLNNRAAAQGIELQLSDAKHTDAVSDWQVTADPRRIDQLMQNILENSLAYTDAPGQINVSLSRSPDTVCITIEDTSPGVNAKDCEKLFDPLFRKEASRSRRTGGAGLGLAICRNIVTAHGGSINALPSALGGLRVHIELPLSGAGNA